MRLLVAGGVAVLGWGSGRVVLGGPGLRGDLEVRLEELAFLRRWVGCLGALVLWAAVAVAVAVVA